MISSDYRQVVEACRMWAEVCGSSDHNSMSIYGSDDGLMIMAYTMLMTVGRVIRRVERKG